MEEFYIILLSNSCMTYYPNNTTTHFTTKLPRHLDLAGDWRVALMDIHIPLTFSTLPKAENARRVRYSRKVANFPEEMDFDKGEFLVSSGVYSSLDQLISQINDRSAESHIQLTLKTGSLVNARTACGINCNVDQHSFELSPELRRIFGFEDGKTEKFVIKRNGDIDGNTPGNLHANVPTNLLVYADICKPYITGDVYSRLLRNVALDGTAVAYGGVLSKSFSQPIYVPLLCPTFETIEIDLRTATGQPVPFDFGTLTLTLHFRKHA